jgi:hypothetical protein
MDMNKEELEKATVAGRRWDCNDIEDDFESFIAGAQWAKNNLVGQTPDQFERMITVLEKIANNTYKPSGFGPM